MDRARLSLTFGEGRKEQGGFRVSREGKGRERDAVIITTPPHLNLSQLQVCSKTHELVVRYSPSVGGG